MEPLQVNMFGNYKFYTNTNNNTLRIRRISCSKSGRMIKSVDGGNNWISKNVPDVDVQAIGL
jgi:hypothetical protein